MLSTFILSIKTKLSKRGLSNKFGFVIEQFLAQKINILNFETVLLNKGDFVKEQFLYKNQHIEF